MPKSKKYTSLKRFVGSESVHGVRALGFVFSWELSSGSRNSTLLKVEIVKDACCMGELTLLDLEVSPF
jgi:hypothetical protein